MEDENQKLKDQEFMRDAINEAKKAFKMGEVPVGAVLVNNGKIVSRGYNKPIMLNDPTAHAEIQVLRSGGKKLNNYRLSNSTLYVTIEPCLMCLGSIINARVKRVVYGAPDPKAGAIVSKFKILDEKRLNHYPEVTPGVLAEECKDIIVDFFKRCREK